MLPFAILAMLGGCDTLAGDCTSEGRPFLIATIADAATGRPVVAGVTLVASAGTARDSVIVPSGETPSGLTTVTLFEGHLPAGAYTVDIRHAGYVDWHRTGVAVTTERCGHAIATRVVAGLTARP